MSKSATKYTHIDLSWTKDSSDKDFGSQAAHKELWSVLCILPRGGTVAPEPHQILTTCPMAAVRKCSSQKLLPNCVLQRSPSASRWRHKSTRTSVRLPPWRASNSFFVTFPRAKPYLSRRGGGCSKSLKNITPWYSSSISPAPSETYNWRALVWLPRCTSQS